jgi:1-phosphatidylinositol-4-phosphate 5-kinase
MESLLRVPKKAALLTFDMKGSTYNREVLKKFPNVDKSSKVLKDLDFLRLEKCMHLEEDTSERLCKQMIKDAKFFER